MGIRFYCPNGHKLNVKEFQAGRKGICPFCGVKMQIPLKSTRLSSKEEKAQRQPEAVLQEYQEQNTVPVPGPGVAPMASAPVESAPAGPVSQYPGVSPEQAAVAGRTDAASAAGSLPKAQVSIPARAPHAIPSPTAGPAPAAAVPTAAPDPLAEAGDAVWYVRPASGGQFGPAGSEAMRHWIDEGRVGADSLVWREGWRDWQEASEVFPQLGGGKIKIAPPAGEVSAAVSSAATTTRRGQSWRRKSKSTQMTVIIVLIFSVIALSVAFAWVMLR